MVCFYVKVSCFYPRLHDINFSGNALSLFAKGLDLDEVIACSNSVTGSGSDGISVSPDFLQNDKDPGAAPTRYYVLRNCPIPAVNGRYMDGGFHEGAPVYRNVREWALGTFWIHVVTFFAETFTDYCHYILLLYYSANQDGGNTRAGHQCQRKLCHSGGVFDK